MNPGELEAQLAAFAADVRWDRLPPRVRERAHLLFIDTIASAIAGRRAASIHDVDGIMRGLAGGGDAVVIGGEPMAATGAVFVNAYQVTVYTMCDVYRPALCHVTPVLVPPLLAVAAERGVDGHRFLESLVVGLEATTRLGLGVDYPAFRARGWHSPGVIGPPATALALATMTGADHETAARAMGLGASQSSGTFAALGTSAVKFHQARGAVSALWAWRFAESGLGGAVDGITSDDGGLFATTTPSPRPDAVVADLGEHWELEEISMRRWPAASSLQTLVEAAIDVASGHDLALADVERVTVNLPPASYAMCATKEWDDEVIAMQSARWLAASAFDGRDHSIAHLAASRRADASLDRFARERVEVREDPDLSESGVAISVRTVDGREFDAGHDRPVGHPERPLTFDDVAGKLFAAVDEEQHDDARRLLARIDDVVSGADVASFVDELSALARHR